jgi:hypothetical protein
VVDAATGTAAIEIGSDLGVTIKAEHVVGVSSSALNGVVL